ncbi:MAG: elongation factor P [bacterium]|nr:elongation factor P [bacterium]
MNNASDLRKGFKLEIDGDPWLITEFDFRKPGKGQGMYRCKLKNMVTGNTMDKTFRSSDKGITKANLEERDMYFSYIEGDFYVFSDAENYDEFRISKKQLGNQVNFLIENALCVILLFKGRAVEVTLPLFIEKEIIETEPGARGDTATNITKPATIDNGYEIAVPIFINQGDVVKLDTRTGEYVERITKAK